MLIVDLATIIAIPLAVSGLRARSGHDPNVRTLAALVWASTALMGVHYVFVENAFDIFAGSITRPLGHVPIVASVGVLLAAADEYRRMDEPI